MDEKPQLPVIAGNEESLSLSQIIQSMLESSCAKINSEKFQKFFKAKDAFTDSNVDCYINEFLLKALILEEKQQQALFDATDRVVFGDASNLIQKILERILQPLVPLEDTIKVLVFVAEKYMRLRIFPKFCTHLLKAVKTSGRKAFMLPGELLECFTNCALKIPVAQNMSMWISLCSVLKKDSKNFQDNPDGSFPQSSVAAEIFSVLLLNVRLADYSIRDDTTEEAIKSFEVIVERLKSLVLMAIDHPQEFAFPLLTLAFAYGELHQLLLLYSRPYSERQSPTNNAMVIEPVVECNLSLLHSYASPEQWIKLAELTQQTHLLQWAPLILQKIRHLVLFGGRTKQEKEVNKLVKYLVDHIDDCHHLWLNNFKYLLPLINSRQLETIAKKMISSSDYWKQILFDLDVTEKRAVQMAIICAVLRSIHDQSRKRGAEDDTTALLPASQSVLNMLSLQADLWITSTERHVKEVTAWIRQSAEQLRQAMRTEVAFVSSRDLSDLFQPLELLERLPLEYFIGSVHSAALIGLLSLVVSCQGQDAVRNRLWILIVRLLDSGEKLSSLYDCFPSAEFLAWAVPNTQTLLDSANIFAALFDEVLRSPQGLKDAIKWINSADLDLSSLNITVLAMKKLGAQQNKATAVEMSTSLRNHFLKSFPSALSEQTVIALQGALFVLQMYTEQSKKSKSTTEKLIDIEPLLSGLDNIIRVARQGLLSTEDSLGSASTEFLAFLLTNKCKSLTSHLPHGLLVDVWNTYCQSCHPPRWEDRLLRQLIGMSNKGEMLTITNSILKDLQTVSGASEMVTIGEVKRVSRFFRHLVTVEFYTDEPRYGFRLQAVQTALPLIQHSVLSRCRQPNLSSGDVVQFSLPLMEIYLAILNMDKPYVYPHDAASALHACLALPLDAEMSIDTFEAVFTVVYKVLHYLLVKHEEIAADRVPVLLQVYKRLLVQTCTRSDQRRQLESDELVRLTDCANRLSRLASVINSQRMRYRRSATYLVADLMNEFKQRPIYQPVRHELEPALHHLLDLLDHHASRYLLAVLPAGVRELFRVEHEQFEKFYQFKGKV